MKLFTPYIFLEEETDDVRSSSNETWLHTWFCLENEQYFRVVTALSIEQVGEYLERLLRCDGDSLFFEGAVKWYSGEIPMELGHSKDEATPMTWRKETIH